MVRLKLWFTGDTEPQLLRTSFDHDLLPKTLLTVRGKDSRAFGVANTFQWTRAVHALAILLVRAAASAHKSTAGQILGPISGGAATPASSLDYAIAKEPQWIIDMFGFDARGDALLKRMIKRSNPERKRPGPVAIALNEVMLPAGAIEIFLDDRPLEHHTAIANLAETLEQSWLDSSRNRLEIASLLQTVAAPSSLTDETNPLFLPKLMRLALRSEILAMLRRTDIFNQHSIARNLIRLRKNPSLRKLSDGKLNLVSDIDIELAPRHRLGMLSGNTRLLEVLNGDKPLRFAVPALNPAPVALLCYLKHMLKLPIEIDFGFPHSAEILNNILNGNFTDRYDGFILGISHTCVIIRQGLRDIAPFMMMPSLSYRVVSPINGTAAELNSGKYLLLKNETSNAMLYFESLERKGLIHRNKVTTQNSEPDEVPLLLREGDHQLRAILFFPHHHLNRLFNSCRFIDEPTDGMNLMESVLVVSQDLKRNKERLLALDMAFRDAWLELLDGGIALEHVLDILVTDRDYMKFLRRSCGLHNFDPWCINRVSAELAHYSDDQLSNQVLVA